MVLRRRSLPELRKAMRSNNLPPLERMRLGITPLASAASASRNEAPDQGQSFPRLPAASHCWPARNELAIGTTARHDIPVELVWLARRERHQGRARQAEGHFCDRGMSATTTGERYRDSRQGKRHSDVEPEGFVRGDGLARCHQQARPRALPEFGGIATTVKTETSPRNKLDESTTALATEKAPRPPCSR